MSKKKRKQRSTRSVKRPPNSSKKFESSTAISSPSSKQRGGTIKIYIFFLVLSYIFQVYVSVTNAGNVLYLVTNIVVVVFLCVALVIGATKDKYYYPGISDVEDVIYWFAVCMIQSAIIALSLYLQSVHPIIDYVNLMFGIVVILLAISFFQTKTLSELPSKQRGLRIAILAKKSGLNDEELDAVSAQIIEEKQKIEKIPAIWLLTQVVLAFIIALLINTYAEPLLNFLIEIGFAPL